MPTAACPAPRPTAATTHVTTIEVTYPEGYAVDDALDQLRTLARALGITTGAAWSSEGASAAAVQPADHRMAAALGGRLHVAGTMMAQGREIRVWTGPAFVPRDHVLSAAPAGHQCVAVTTADGHRVVHVWPRGAAAPDAPGEDSAGPTAAAADSPVDRDRPAPPWTPPWLVRLGLPHQAPHPAFLCDLLGGNGLEVGRVRADVERESVAWARLGPCTQAHLAAVAARLARTHRLTLSAWRVLGASASPAAVSPLRYPRARCLATS
ncbi:MAG: hypothetical protein AB7H93_17600 [Vicinamibacterales bacterium]